MIFQRSSDQRFPIRRSLSSRPTRVQRAAQRRRRHNQFAWLVIAGEVHQCQLLDVSMYGAKLLTHLTLEPGQEVSIRFVPNGTLSPARIAWQRGRFAGVALA